MGGRDPLILSSEDPAPHARPWSLQERAATMVQRAQLTPEPRAVPADGDTDEPEPEAAQRVPEIVGEALSGDPEVAGHSW